MTLAKLLVIIYNHDMFKAQATVSTIVNYDCNNVYRTGHNFFKTETVL